MATDAPDAAGHFEVVGCSTKTYTPDRLIKLPSNPMYQMGTQEPELKRDTYAVCDWPEDVLVGNVCAIKGHVPQTVYERIVDKINEIRRLQQNQSGS